jgi:2-amino-4-hydroxy-6-hydroxymethyldihydropteridine diphosphokinase
MMKTAILALGSNSGDRKDMLAQALMRISFSCEITQISDVYETYDQDQRGQSYLNCCVEIQTDMTSGQVLLFVKEIQKQMGGTGVEDHLLQIPIDIDLISFEDEIVRTPQLTLPHPDAYRRAFVIIPLSQMRPDWLHPILHKTAAELAQTAFWPGWGTFFADGKSLLDF